MSPLLTPLLPARLSIKYPAAYRVQTGDILYYLATTLK
jgi:hypothetical protein